MDGDKDDGQLSGVISINYSVSPHFLSGPIQFPYHGISVWD